MIAIDANVHHNFDSVEPKNLQYVLYIAKIRGHNPSQDNLMLIPCIENNICCSQRTKVNILMAIVYILIGDACYS